MPSTWDSCSEPDSEDEEVGDDPRIGQLTEFYATKPTPEAFVAKLDELGAKDAIVLGGLCSHRPVARAHFCVSALIAVDQETTLASSVEKAAKHLKAAVSDGEEGAGKLLIAALESYVVHLEVAKAANFAEFDSTLRTLWECDVVDENVIEEWQADERAACQLGVRQGDAEALRERGRAFREWFEAGEE